MLKNKIVLFEGMLLDELVAYLSLDKIFLQATKKGEFLELVVQDGNLALEYDPEDTDYELLVAEQAPQMKMYEDLISFARSYVQKSLYQNTEMLKAMKLSKEMNDFQFLVEKTFYNLGQRIVAFFTMGKSLEKAIQEEIVFGSQFIDDVGTIKECFSYARDYIQEIPESELSKIGVENKILTISGLRRIEAQFLHLETALENNYQVGLERYRMLGLID
jgi:hypothetical protein